MVAQVGLAEELRRRLDGGEARSLADLAGAFRLTQARIAQLLGLLRLAPRLLEYVRGLPAGTPARMVTERGLRPLTRLMEDEQMERAMRSVPGFAVFVERERVTAGSLSGADIKTCTSLSTTLIPTLKSPRDRGGVDAEEPK